MTKVLTIRLTPDLLGKAEARAARMGLDRAKYVRSLIEEDLATGKPHATRRFASEDLAGMYVGSGQATSPPTAAMAAKPSRASFRRPDWQAGRLAGKAAIPIKAAHRRFS